MTAQRGCELLRLVINNWCKHINTPQVSVSHKHLTNPAP